MVNGSGVGGEVPNEWFLRRIAFKRHLRPGQDGIVVHKNAFRGRLTESSLSLTLQDESLQSAESLRGYQSNCQLPSGDLPGVCRVSYQNLVVDVIPPLPPRPEPDPTDSLYGYLHYAIDLPDEVQQQRLAVLATNNVVLLGFQTNTSS